MRKKVFTLMGIIMLVSLVALGFFAFPVGISLCGIVGLIYGIKRKDKTFLAGSSLALLLGTVLAAYTLLLIHAM